MVHCNSSHISFEGMQVMVWVHFPWLDSHYSFRNCFPGTNIHYEKIIVMIICCYDESSFPQNMGGREGLLSQSNVLKNFHAIAIYFYTIAAMKMLLTPSRIFCMSYSFSDVAEIVGNDWWLSFSWLQSTERGVDIRVEKCWGRWIDEEVAWYLCLPTCCYIGMLMQHFWLWKSPQRQLLDSLLACVRYLP